MTNFLPKNHSKNKKTLLETATDYRRRGWQPLPVPAFDKNNPKKNGKNPNRTNWENFSADESELPKYFNGHPQNIGVLLGSKSNGLTDIDLDSPEAVKMADYFLPKTEAVFGRTSKPRSHRLYVSDFPKMEKFEFGESIVEIRSTGGQTVFPPSMHETGEIIEWQNTGEPARIDAKDLRRAVALLASACIVSKFWRNGIRHELSLAVSGAMLNNGYTRSETENFIRAVCYASGDNELSDRLSAVKTTAERRLRNEKVFGFPKLADLTDQKLASKVQDWLGVTANTPPIYFGQSTGAPSPNTNGTTADPALVIPVFLEEPKPLDFVLKPVQEIDTDCLPKLLIDWLVPAAAVIGCPLDFLVLSAIVSAGSVIGSRIRLKPVQHSDWCVPPNLYGGLVGPPSSKKTPALDETRKPIQELQAEAQKENKIAKADYEIEKKLYEKLSDRIYKGFKGNDPAALKLQLASLNKPKEPVLKRFETNDITSPKLIQFLADNPIGFMLFRDELAGWLRSLEADYDKSARAFFLELWKGAISYELARSDGRETQITSGTLSIIGGIQPSKLQKYVSEAYSFDNSDGFLQRFVFVYPDIRRRMKKPTQSDYDAMRMGFNKACKVFHIIAEFNFHGKVIGHNGDVFHVVKFNSAAQKVVDLWAEENEVEAERMQNKDEAFSSFLYKIPKNCFAIALIFHCLENIEAAFFPDEISEETALKAITYTEILISHAKRVFALGENQIFSLADIFIGKIKAGELHQGFTKREIGRKKWSGLNNSESIDDVLGLLVDYGYLQEITAAGVGRHTKRYYFHPSLEAEVIDEDELEN